MINNVVLVGRLTKDCDLRYTSSGIAVATFNLAVNRNFTGQNGERETDFISCVVWRKPAETIANYTKKGSLIAVDGRLQTRNYENQQGQRVYVTEVIVENFQFLESKAAMENRQQNSVQTPNQQTTPQHGQNGFARPDREMPEYPFGGKDVEGLENDFPF